MPTIVEILQKKNRAAPAPVTDTTPFLSRPGTQLIGGQYVVPRPSATATVTSAAPPGSVAAKVLETAKNVRARATTPTIPAATPTTTPLSEFPPGLVPAFPGEPETTWHPIWGYVKPEHVGPPAGTFGPLFGGTAEPPGFKKPDVPTEYNVPTEYQELFNKLKAYLDELKRRGEAVNPNIEITTEKAAEFMAQAAREIDPFYSTQLNLAREGLLRTIGYSTDEILRQEQDLERQYGREVRSTGEQFAEMGFALSGRRIEEERELAEQTQQQIDERRRQSGFAAGTQARQFAQLYGGQNIPGRTLPEAPTVTPGETRFGRTERQLPFYEISPEVYEGLVGSQQFEQEAAKRRRASELESGFRTQEALKQQRTLIF